MGYHEESDQVPTIFSFTRVLYLIRSRIKIVGIASSQKRYVIEKTNVLFLILVLDE
jgi:hypothetical protein